MHCELLRAKVTLPNDISFFCSIVHSGHSYVKSAISYNPSLEWKLLWNLLRISEDSWKPVEATFSNDRSV